METINDIFAQKRCQPTTFGDYLECYADEVGEIVNSYIPRGTHVDMDTYLYDPVLAYSQNGGKRHRPLALFAACRAVGGDMNKAMSAAAAIELFHTAALVHDDIADDAELRRGEPCLHLTQGEGLAINMGDLGLMLVCGTVMKDPALEDALKIRVVTELADMTRRTIEGQALDVGWARDRRFDITPEDYLVMAIHKTAHYSGAVPLAIGAMIGGGTEEQIAVLREFGLQTGLAFQIQDDLLNLVETGDEKGEKAKDFRNDITEGKRTLIAVHALQNSPQRDRLIEILSAHTKDEALLAEAVDIMEASGSIAYAREYAAGLTIEAKKRLMEVLEPGDMRDLLVSMADWFVNRLS